MTESNNKALGNKKEKIKKTSTVALSHINNYKIENSIIYWENLKIVFKRLYDFIWKLNKMKGNWNKSYNILLFKFN